MGLPDSRGVSRDPRYLGTRLKDRIPFAYRTITFYGPTYPVMFG